MLRSRLVDHESLVIVLSAGGSPLDGGSLGALADAAVVWVRVECEGSAACLAARVRHGDPPDAFRDRVRRWGAARGWAVTVASGRPRG
ncbi:MAG: hypothetical protein DMD52_00330 [Gemmatimonadetes bacterium]|nr:MAG: hypothetical protein DMD52_00330 [Gemmatimonadota bacterium]